MSILSPHGEGYCTECRFIVGLDERGRLQEHTRGVHARDRYLGRPEPCSRSGRKPAPAGRVPYTARKSRFQYEPPTAFCPKCGQYVRVTYQGSSDVPYYLRHRRGPGRMGDCPTAGLAVFSKMI